MKYNFCNIATGLFFLMAVVASAPPNHERASPRRSRKAADNRRERLKASFLKHRRELEMPRRPRHQQCSGRGCCYSGVQVSLASGEGLVFCSDCNDPHVQGVLLQTYEAATSQSPFTCTDSFRWLCPTMPRGH